MNRRDFSLACLMGLWGTAKASTKEYFGPITNLFGGKPKGMAEELAERLNKEDWLRFSYLEGICERNYYTPNKDNVISYTYNLSEDDDEITHGHMYKFYPQATNRYCDENSCLAYTNIGNGKLPERNVGGDCVSVPNYRIGMAIDWFTEYEKERDVIKRAFELLHASYVKKVTDDMFHTFIAAGTDRNILMYDGDTKPGEFSPRLISLMKHIAWNRDRDKLTHIVISPEAHEQTKEWADKKSYKILRHQNGCIQRILGVNLISLDEMGEKQEYQTFFKNSVNGHLESHDKELVIGLNNGTNNAMFIQPTTNFVCRFLW
jgi:hypothetical protein